MAELLNDNVKQQIRDVFAELKGPVHVLFFGAQENCDYCNETRQLAEEVVALSDKLSLGIHDILADSALAARYHVDNTPALVIAAKDGKNITDYGIRLLGIPSGHEFSSLIQDILLVSSRDSGLSQPTRDFLKSVKSPVLLQVFSTPT